MKKALYVILFTLSLAANAQTTGTIVGKVTDREMNDEPLPFANILIKGTTKGTTSDFDGLFELDGVAEGTYTLQFSFLGYETIEVPDVIVKGGQVTEVNVPLSASQGVALEEVVVTTSVAKDSEIALLLEQKKALVIQEAISAEALTMRPQPSLRFPGFPSSKGPMMSM
jgi:hypothetical protein